MCPDLTDNKTPCQLSFQTNFTSGATGVDNVVVAKDGKHTFLVSNCKRVDMEATVSYTFKNPGGYLGTNLAPVIPLALSMTILWSLIFVIWLANFLRFRKSGNASLQLQKFIALPAVLAAVGAGLGYWWWNACHETGECPGSTGFMVSYSALDALIKALVWLVLILVAKGFSITRAVLSRREMGTIALVCFLAFIANFLFNQFNSFFSLLY